MRAVNLIPSDQRTGGLSGGRSGGMVYGALGALVLLLLAVSVYALAGRDAKTAEQELAQVQTATQQYQAAANQYAAYEKAAADATARIQAVKSLADARFDWAGAMRDLSRVVPAETQVMQLSANVRSGAAAPTTNSSLRDALDVPAITMLGCSATQRTVADLITRLQALRRVSQVSLERSARAGAGEGGAGGDALCTVKAANPYTFTIVVFYTPGSSKPGADAAAGTSPGAPAVAPEASGTTTTASTGN